MAIRQKRSSKKIARSGRHKNKYQAYITRSTCGTCRVVFKSPDKKKAHAESGHKDMTGANKNRQVKGYESIFDKFGERS